ncbi:nuclear transport factor 2 family protein [Streptomyces sp. NPDC057474]|uniref:nuclear transport factor 2 family protein n=1 Tax=Streptomyces sp. NPDC057474 TaxID=3346144 RepID=UPI00369DCE18
MDVGRSAAKLTAEQAADRLLILEVINRYAWSYDERDMDALGRSFTEDAVFAGNLAGSVEIGPINGRDAIVEWLRGHMDSQSDQRRHSVTNPTFVSQTEDGAVVNAFLVLAAVSDGQVRLVTTGFYKVDVRKTTDGWAISRLFGGFDTAF